LFCPFILQKTDQIAFRVDNAERADAVCPQHLSGFNQKRVGFDKVIQSLLGA
jgi:hypothetical protein